MEDLGVRRKDFGGIPKGNTLVTIEKDDAQAPPIKIERGWVKPN